MKNASQFALLITIVLSLSAITVGAADPPPDLPGVIEFQARMGQVTFPHDLHHQQYDCQTCHHTDGYQSCGQCHGARADAPKRKDAFHALCKDCHSKEARGPAKCKECHVK